MLPLLDKLFGTLHLPKDWPTEYGCDANVAPSLLGQLALTRRQAELRTEQ
jgi:sterol desaturase/sphingolipid hydroxylase (fatty acid hydroxylase superfamily)